MYFNILCIDLIVRGAFTHTNYHAHVNTYVCMRTLDKPIPLNTRNQIGTNASVHAIDTHPLTIKSMRLWWCWFVHGSDRCDEGTHILCDVNCFQSRTCTTIRGIHICIFVDNLCSCRNQHERTSAQLSKMRALKHDIEHGSCLVPGQRQIIHKKTNALFRHYVYDDDLLNHPALRYRCVCV